MIRALYSLFTRAAQPLLRRKLRRRGRDEPGYLEAIDERFGFYGDDAPVQPGALWIHAVSLGETRAAALLVDALRRQDPSLRLLLTHGTATGRAQGRSLLRPGDRQAWQPWDTPEAVDRFLAHFRPAAGILMETEVWPNLIARSHAHGVPLALVNARLSEASMRGARRLSWLMRPAYAAFSAVWPQTQADADRLAAVGARVSAVLGNLKFDIQPDPAQLARARAWRQGLQRPVWMFASSRQGEEAMFLQALAAARDAGLSPDKAQWLVVPRHPQRFDEVAGLIAQAGLCVARRSEWGDGPPPPADVWLGDSLGEMVLYYGLSDAALLGGSFAPLGGQNLIEAAACGCPIVMGPHTFNFSEAAQRALQAGAAWRVQDMAQAVRHLLTLEPQALSRAAQATQAFTAADRGCAERTASAVLALMRG